MTVYSYKFYILELLPPTDILCETLSECLSKDVYLYDILSIWVPGSSSSTFMSGSSSLELLISVLM